MLLLSALFLAPSAFAEPVALSDCHVGDWQMPNLRKVWRQTKRRGGHQEWVITPNVDAAERDMVTADIVDGNLVLRWVRPVWTDTATVERNGEILNYEGVSQERGCSAARTMVDAAIHAARTHH